MINPLFTLFQHKMSSEKIQSITEKEKKEAYTFLHEKYLSYYDSLGNKPSNVDNYFSWIVKPLDLNIVYFTRDNEVSSFFFYSISEESGTIKLHDLININFTYEIVSLNVEDFLSKLITDQYIHLDANKIIKLGIFSVGHVIYESSKFLFQYEYEYNFKPQLQPVFERINFNSLQIHKELYNFTEMTKTIGNDQFTLELNECLDAYENGKFFVCAAGLGSVLEHLLYLSIEKHVPESEIKTNENSTASEYIGQLKKAPFKISKRDVSHLKNIFAYRNSVSHFNKGIFNKDMCDQLLAGIKLCFDNYYLFNTRNNINIPT